MNDKQNKQRELTPKLRFPEFREAGEWGTKQLREITSEFLDGDWIESKDQSSNGIRLLQTGNIGVGIFIPKVENSRYISEETFHRLRCEEVFPGDCLISRLPDPAGRSCLVPDVGQRMITAVDCTIVRFDKQQIIPYIFILYSQTEQYFQEVTSLCSGSTRQRISRENLSQLKIAIPEIQEQQKIAECLSSLNERITAEAQKLDTLKTHKKGLMQQLFPAEDETLPKLRFPKFRDAGEWEEKKLGEIGDVLMCKRIFANDTNDSSGVPFYKIGTLGGKPDAFISKNLFDEYKSKYSFPRKGEILITCSGTVGKYLPYDGKDAYYQDSNIVWIDNPTLKISNEFLHDLLLNINWESLNSTTITRIYGSDLRTLSLTFPPDHQEQQKIADCLSSLDDLITAQTQKLAALKTHKKGLMQQLFPNTPTESTP